MSVDPAADGEATLLCRGTDGNHPVAQGVERRAMPAARVRGHGPQIAYSQIAASLLISRRHRWAGAAAKTPALFCVSGRSTDYPPVARESRGSVLTVDIALPEVEEL